MADLIHDYELPAPFTAARAVKACDILSEGFKKMNEKDTATIMKELLDKIKGANESLKLRQQELSQARSRECDSQNMVNSLQNEFDKLFAVMKKEAPADTDWKKSTLEKHPVM